MSFLLNDYSDFSVAAGTLIDDFVEYEEKEYRVYYKDGERVVITGEDLKTITNESIERRIKKIVLMIW